MIVCRRNFIAVMLVLIATTGRARGENPAPAADIPPLAETPVGRAIIDTDSSAKREGEFEKTPYMPEVFAHQWVYKTPAVTTPDTGGES